MMTLTRGFVLLAALGMTACATTPRSGTLNAQSLLESMSSSRAASVSSCSAANMALVCKSSQGNRIRSLVNDGDCSCADRMELNRSFQ